LNKLSHFWRKI